MKTASLILLGLVACTTSPEHTDDPVETDDPAVDLCADLSLAVAEVDPSRLMDTLTWLTSYPTRADADVQAEVIATLRAELDAAGAATRLHEYTFRGETWHNLVATVPATASLEPGVPHLVVGAHVDSTSEIPGTAPGADDNGSGVSGLLETGRVLAQCEELAGRVDLVFFTNEEIGLVGSTYYARDAAAAGEVITGMIGVDMIAYGPEGEDLDLSTKPGMEWLPRTFAEAVEEYVELDLVEHIDDHCG